MGSMLPVFRHPLRVIPYVIIIAIAQIPKYVYIESQTGENQGVGHLTCRYPMPESRGVLT